MILSKALSRKTIVAEKPSLASLANETETLTLTELAAQLGGGKTTSGEHVTPQNSKTVATAYRAGNIISDDVAKIPFQMYQRNGRNVEQVQPDARTLNLAYLLEVSPNQWGWTPFQFKKSLIQWQIYHGNAIVWRPPVWPPQLLILPANRTRPVFDANGSLWYEHHFWNGAVEYIPDVEILHLMINPDETGFWGRGVVTFARETLGRQMGAYRTQAKMYAQGMSAAAYMQFNGKLDKKGRQTIRDEYEKAMSGSENAYRLAVFDNAIVKFEPIQMKMTDAQFLEQIRATDLDIANFFGMALSMLNMGKESYASNEQKYIEYLQGTLDAYLVPFEQAARIRWLTASEQGNTYFKFVREALLRMDAKGRAEMNEVLLRSRQRTPNELRGKDDMSADPEGDNFYITSNYVRDTGVPNAQP
jgi:HK97 family phage portal protein